MKKHRLYEGAGAGYTVTLKDVIVFSGKKEDILDVDVKTEKIGDRDYLLFMIKTRIPAQLVDWVYEDYYNGFSSEYLWDGSPWDGGGEISGGTAVIPFTFNEYGIFADFVDSLISAGFTLDDFLDSKKLEEDGEEDKEVILKYIEDYVDGKKIMKLFDEEQDKANRAVASFFGRIKCSSLSNRFSFGWFHIPLDEKGIELEGQWSDYENDCVCLVKGDIIKNINSCYDAMMEDEEEDEGQDEE